jgi:hypothetical protein
MENPALDRQLRDAARMHLAAHLPHIVAQKYLQVIENAVNAKKYIDGNRTGANAQQI